MLVTIELQNEQCEWLIERYGKAWTLRLQQHVQNGLWRHINERKTDKRLVYIDNAGTLNDMAANREVVNSGAELGLHPVDGSGGHQRLPRDVLAPH